MRIYLAETSIIYIAAASEGMERNMREYLTEHNQSPENNGIKISLADGMSRHTQVQPAPDVRFRVLLSYWYYKDHDLDALFAKHLTRPYPDTFADSGAFTAWSRGAQVSKVDYAKWLHKYKHLFSVYANLDVIKDAEATWQNQQWLEREGLSPLPVFHVTEDWSHLERYLERYSYIALGVGGHRASVLMPWLVQCFKRAKGRTLYHGFGMTTWEVLKAFPWYSVDSSSWGQGFRFGGVPIFDSQRGRFFKVQLGDHDSCYKRAALLRSLGFDAADFADRKRNDRKKICGLAAFSYIKAEQWLQKRWGPITLSTDVEQRGPKLYLAETQADLSDIRNVIPCLVKEREKEA